jgi:hypothetical protein
VEADPVVAVALLLPEPVVVGGVVGDGLASTADAGNELWPG